MLYPFYDQEFVMEKLSTAVHLVSTIPIKDIDLPVFHYLNDTGFVACNCFPHDQV